MNEKNFGVLSVPPFGSLPFARFDSISDAVWGFRDVMPIATLRWNPGVNNYMTYITGDVPVYSMVSLSLFLQTQREVNDETCSDRRKRGRFGFNRLGGVGQCTSRYQPERLPR